MEKKNENYTINGQALKRYFDFNEALFEFHKLFNLEGKDQRTIAVLGGTFLETIKDEFKKFK